MNCVQRPHQAYSGISGPRLCPQHRRKHSTKRNITNLQFSCSVWHTWHSTSIDLLGSLFICCVFYYSQNKQDGLALRTWFCRGLSLCITFYCSANSALALFSSEPQVPEISILSNCIILNILKLVLDEFQSHIFYNKLIYFISPLVGTYLCVHLFIFSVLQILVKSFCSHLTFSKHSQDTGDRGYWLDLLTILTAFMSQATPKWAYYEVSKAWKYHDINVVGHHHTTVTGEKNHGPKTRNSLLSLSESAKGSSVVC